MSNYAVQNNGELVELFGDIPEDTQSPPQYSLVAEDLTREAGSLQENGRINVNLDSKVARTLAKIIDLQQEDIHNPPPEYVDEIYYTTAKPCGLTLNIVIQIVGSRGDVQPFIALGTALRNDGHRVRIATHDVFAEFVRQSDLEFYPIGGDPAELMSFMVKNPGLIPQMKSLREGEIRKKQAMVATMLDGCWRSCIDDDPNTGAPFVADAIIANPPSFAHVHCAQALGIPVHLMFTMPWSSTKAFAHPLANLHPSSMNPTTANWVSFGVVEWLTWQGLGNVINQWRVSINLDPIPATQGPCLAEALHIPFTYCWSPALIPKPRDWPAHIDVCGFFFRDSPLYNPPPDLEDFLIAGPPPIYIGFGSIVVDDPQKLMYTVLDAIDKAGVRAIVSKGWSNMSGNTSKSIYYIDECPHEWLFQHVSAVVHHGGAGTTACGLLNGKPTAVVPFFGDQPFWGNMIATAGAGPQPIPYAALTFEKLAAAILYCLTPKSRHAACLIAGKMRTERGVMAAVESFYKNLPLDKMRCSVIPDQAAVWVCKKNKRSLNLSKAAASTLIEHMKIEEKHLQCLKINPIVIENRRWDPLTGIFSASLSTGSNMLLATSDMIYNPYKEFKRGRSPKASGDQNLRSQSLPQTRASSLSRSGSNLTTDSLDPITSSGEVRGDQLPKSLATAGNMASATMKGFGKFTATYFKGVVVDIPHAAAEGFRQVPRLYGEEPKDYGKIEGWKSGAIFGGRNFVDGMADGFTGIFTEPVKGAKEGGALGAAKGLMKGTIGLATKVPSAGVGLVAYPFHGITKSIETAVGSKGRKALIQARLRDGLYQTEKMNLSDEEISMIVERFETISRIGNV